MTLGTEEIKRRLSPLARIDEERIFITPLLDKGQIGSVEINLRLGRQFIIFKQHLQSSLGPLRLSEYDKTVGNYQEEVVVPYDKNIVLHPGGFIIASTLEYVALPRDIEAQVEGRSSWARLGLVIASATTIHPMFKGVITLELSNNGTIPIELIPGYEIAQIVFHKVHPPITAERESRYSFSIGPGFSKIFNDKILK